jgi:hypothetical protein
LGERGGWEQESDWGKWGLGEPGGIGLWTLELELEKKKEVVVREHAAFVRRCPVVFARLRPSRRVPVRCPKPLPNFTHNLSVQSTISGRAFIPFTPSFHRPQQNIRS